MLTCHVDYNQCLETNILRRESQEEGHSQAGRRRYIVNNAFLEEQAGHHEESNEIFSF